MIDLTLPATPASHGTSVLTRSALSPPNHRFFHLSPIAHIRCRAFFLRTFLLLRCSLTSSTPFITSISFTHHHDHHALLAEHLPHRRSRLFSRLCRMLQCLVNC